jgi:hypothetical protein
MPTMTAGRFRQNPNPLVITNGLDFHHGLFGKRADGQSLSWLRGSQPVTHA